MFKSNLFKLNRNRRYNYTPRYYQGKEIENPYDFDSTFNKYRDTYNANDYGKNGKKLVWLAVTVEIVLFRLPYSL